MSRIPMAARSWKAAVACAMAVVALAGVWLVTGGLGATARAQGTPLHGIAFSKGCDSPTIVGAPTPAATRWRMTRPSTPRWTR